MFERRKWEVHLHRKVEKAVDRKSRKKLLPLFVIEALEALKIDLECFGPTLGLNSKNWPHFGPLEEGQYHCHLLRSKGGHSGKKQKGPCYVACWKIEDKKIKILEVYYVGSHEGAPY